MKSTDVPRSGCPEPPATCPAGPFEIPPPYSTICGSSHLTQGDGVRWRRHERWTGAARSQPINPGPVVAAWRREPAKRAVGCRTAEPPVDPDRPPGADPHRPPDRGFASRGAPAGHRTVERGRPVRAT